MIRSCDRWLRSELSEKAGRGVLIRARKADRPAGRGVSAHGDHRCADRGQPKGQSDEEPSANRNAEADEEENRRNDDNAQDPFTTFFVIPRSVEHQRESSDRRAAERPAKPKATARQTANARRPIEQARRYQDRAERGLTVEWSERLDAIVEVLPAVDELERERDSPAR